MAPPRIPDGVTFKQAARAGAWLLGLRQHNRAKRRIASVPMKAPRCLADEFVRLFWPWEAWQYPGKFRGFAGLLGFTSQSYARNLMAGRQRVPLKHLRRMVDYLEGRISLQRSLVDRLRVEIERRERERLFPPSGYANGLARWRREQAARKLGVMTVGAKK